MPVGSHKDAFKAHQLVKKLVDKDRPTPLASLAAEVLLDFVKNQRQIAADGTLDHLPDDAAPYDAEKIAAALNAVGSLCGQCEEAHDDACFVNQARRVLIAAKTGVDIGSFFDGKKTFEQMLTEAEAKADVLRMQRAAAEAVAAVGTTTNPQAAPSQPENRPAQELLQDIASSASGLGQTGKPALNAAEREELEMLREKDIFRATLIDEVVQTISSVTDGNYAAEMPVHEDEQLGKLATAFNMMLRAIHSTMSGLDKLVQERSAELKQIMDTVPLGLLTLNPELRVNPEYSRAAETILGEATLRGRDFLDLLGLTRRREAERQKLVEYLELFQLRLLPDDDLAPLNPYPELELELHGAQEDAPARWIRLIYHALKPKDGAEKAEVLVEIADISEAKRLASQVAASQQENMQIRAIASDPELFRDFLAEVRKILGDCESGLGDLHPGAAWKDQIHALFRGVHTIKGSSGSFGLGGVAREAGALEDDLGKARDLSELPDGYADKLRAPLGALRHAVAEVEEIARPILGDEVDSDVPHVRVRLDALKEIESVLRLGAPADEMRTQLTEKLRNLQDIPAKKALSRSVKLVPGLIRRLSKEAGFSFGGGDVLIPYETGVALNGPLTHLLRNAFDHGIEEEEARRAANKPPKGMVTLTVLRFAHEYTVTLSDDGRGLDPQRLRESALRKGVITAEEAALLKDKDAQMLIFRPGFSTAASVTDVSGRGVGMDAVLATVRGELDGYIDVDSTPGKGSIFTIHIPLPL